MALFLATESCNLRLIMLLFTTTLSAVIGECHLVDNVAVLFVHGSKGHSILSAAVVSHRNSWVFFPIRDDVMRRRDKAQITCFCTCGPAFQLCNSTLLRWLGRNRQGGMA
jgi:hypothetical protein